VGAEGVEGVAFVWGTVERNGKKKKFVASRTPEYVRGKKKKKRKRKAGEEEEIAEAGAPENS
jgi:hypothetical protein